MTIKNIEKFVELLSESTQYVANHNIRHKSLSRINEMELPNRQTEDWRHTNINRILETDYILSKTEKSIELPRMWQEKTDRIVIVNGIFSEQLSTISESEITFCSMQKAKIDYADLFEKHFNTVDSKQVDIFSEMNTAFSNDGFFISIENNKKIQAVINILHIVDSKNRSAFSQSRNLIILNENSEATVNEEFIAFDESSLYNSLTEIIIQKNSKLNFCSSSDKSVKLNLLSKLRVNQGFNSTFKSCNFILDGELVRNEISVNHLESNCYTTLSGLYLPTANQHHDIYTYLNHAIEHCESDQLYKGVIPAKASAVYYGRIYVARDAQKTNSNQSNKNILLSNQGKINSKPQLEIYADDVKCSHGSTVGQLDKEALFYLQTRGIGKDEARKLLLAAFVAEVVSKIENAEIRNRIQLNVENRLNVLFTNI